MNAISGIERGQYAGSFPETPSSSTEEKVAQKAQDIINGEQPHRITKARKKISTSFCYGEEHKFLSPKFPEEKSLRAETRKILRKPSSLHLPYFRSSDCSRKQDSGAESKLLPEGVKAKKFNGHLARRVKSEIDKYGLQIAKRKALSAALSTHLKERFLKRMENGKSIPKSLEDLMNNEDRLAAELQKGFGRDSRLFKDQFKALKFTLELMSECIEERREHTAEALGFSDELKHIMNLFDRTPFPLDEYRKKLLSCLESSPFGDLLYAAFGGREKTCGFWEQMDLYSGYRGLSLIREEIHILYWTWIRASKSLSTPLLWEGEGDIKPPLDEMDPGSLVRCFIPDDLSGVLFSEIRVNGESLSLGKRQFPFFRHLLQKIYNSGFWGEFSDEEIEKEVNRLFKHEEIVAGDILRLATIGCWSRCDNAMRKRFPALFNKDFSRRTAENTLKIEILSAAKHVVTQSKKYLFFDGSHERLLFTCEVTQKVFLEKTGRVNSYSGAISISFPCFETVSPDEKQSILSKFI